MPERLFQILITDGPPAATAFTDDLLRNIQSFKSAYPGATYQRLGDEEILDFLSDNHPAPVLKAYRAITPYAFKADLARYCLLFTHGGLYSDLSYLHLRPIEFNAECELDWLTAQRLTGKG